MTHSPSSPTGAIPSSRRALLAGALGGIGALVASAVGRASPVHAEGEAIVVGGYYPTAQTVTRLKNTINANTVIWGESVEGVGIVGSSTDSLGVLGTSENYYAIKGESNFGSGVWGHSNTSVGVVGESISNTGVGGHSDTYYGVEGQSGSSLGVAATSISYFAMIGANAAPDYAAIVGRATANSTGLMGLSGTDWPGSKPKTGVYGSAVQDQSSKGVWGQSTAGHGIHGSSSTGWAGWFSGRVYTSSYHELSEISAPGAPGTNRGRLFLRDNGAGKTQLCVRFNTGGVQVLATQP